MNLHHIAKAWMSVLFIACLFSAVIASAQPEAKPLAPQSLAGMKMKFKDLHGDYTVTFSENGTYTFVSSREGEKPETRRGKYEWKAMSPRHAVLTFGENEVYKLTFDSATEATGWAEDDFRPYAFHFEKVR